MGRGVFNLELLFPFFSLILGWFGFAFVVTLVFRC
jgi:hypothetical protein